MKGKKFIPLEALTYHWQQPH